MTVLVAIEIGIIALATWPARVSLCPAALPQVQSPEVIRVSLGPMIDMDNRRRDEDEAKERKRKEQLREQYRYYGYAHPPGGYNYAYPPGGYSYTYPPPIYTYPDPHSRYYYSPRYYYPRSSPDFYGPKAGYYRDPITGGYYYLNPRSVDPGNQHPNRPNE